MKRKQTALRASLEELIVEYLRGLTGEGDNDLSNEYFEHHRERREKRERRKNDANVRSNEVTGGSVADNIEIDVLSESDRNGGSDRRRLRFGATENITDVESEEYNEDGSSRKHGKVATKKDAVCTEQKRRISHLDRNVLEQALANESDYEHNIRRLLNYR